MKKKILSRLNYNLALLPLVLSMELYTSQGNAEKLNNFSKKGLEKIVYSESGMPSEIYQRRFAEFEEAFDEYAAESPRDLSDDEFKALLLAIAKRESSLGYPNNRRNDFMIMGYGNQDNEAHIGIENQLRLASNTLKEAFENRNPNYRSAKEKKGKEKILTILSIYNQGQVNQRGMEYANEVYQDLVKWKNYLGNN